LRKRPSTAVGSAINHHALVPQPLAEGSKRAEVLRTVRAGVGIDTLSFF